MVRFFLRWTLMFAVMYLNLGRTFADPNVYEYAVPPSIERIQATAETRFADLGVLRDISSDFANGYRIKKATYTFTAPDKLEYKARVGLLEVTYTTTNSRRTVSSNFFIHSNTDISHDLTKRNTLQALGLLPVNYLDTMHIQYFGTDTVNGVETIVFVMRYLNDAPDASRRFQFWIDPIKRYIVQKRVWDGHGNQRETIIYKDPKEVLPNFWMPTDAEVYSPSMKLGAVLGYVNISAN